MPNNYLSVLYKHIIQVENKNVGLKVGGGGGGGAQTYLCHPNQKHGGVTCPPLPPPPRVLRQWYFKFIFTPKYHCISVTNLTNQYKVLSNVAFSELMYQRLFCFMTNAA